MNNFQHITTETDGDNHHWITIATHNTAGLIPVALLHEFKAALTSIAENSSLKGLIIQAATTNAPKTIQHEASSGKAKPPTQEEILETVKCSQEVLQLLTELDLPSVVLLDGLSSIYGMPLAMAASYCLASDNSNNSQGFIAAKLGVHSDIITTQNTIRRLGTSIAMDYLLTGDFFSPQQAVEKGLLDACVPAAKLETAAKNLLRNKPRKQQAGFTKQLTSLVPSRLLKSLNLNAKARHIGPPQNYPAPYALLELWKKHGMRNTAAAQQDYAKSITTLSQTPQSISLSYIAKLEKRLKQGSTKPALNPIKHTHIIGSGMTAGDVATYLLIQGLNVTLQDKQPAAINQTVDIIKQNLTKEYAYRADQITTLLTNLTMDPEGKAILKANLILVMKGSHLADNQEIFANLEENARPDAILAAHSTTLALDKITAAMLSPQRLIGIHFCYPAFKTKLVEVSFTDKIDAKILEQAHRGLHQLGKMPLVMKNTPGLLVDRTLVQYILQGIRLNQQGVPQTIIDCAGRDSGMPDGPLELADKLGLDYCLRVAEALERAYQINIPYQLIDMAKTGKLGLKSGTGFYRYRNGNRLKPDRVEWDGSRQALQEKLTAQIREEAALCLEEGLIEDPGLIDAGIIFGTGLAPYKGGPLYQQRHQNTSNTRA